MTYTTLPLFTLLRAFTVLTTGIRDSQIIVNAWARIVEGNVEIALLFSVRANVGNLVEDAHKWTVRGMPRLFFDLCRISSANVRLRLFSSILCRLNFNPGVFFWTF